MSQRTYAIGQSPPLGVVPERMFAAVIRRERFGEPARAIQTETVAVPAPGRGQVLVHVMAAGVNYNNVWAALGQPIDVISLPSRKDGADFHIGGSEGAGVVWAVGEGVKNVKVGDEVVLSCCQWDEQAEDVRLGGDPMLSRTQVAWGYEANFGTFAQFALADEYQCHPKPPNLTWEEAAVFMATGATSYRQLCGWPPHTVQPGDPVLIWGGAGGLGSMAIQIAHLRGGIPVAVVSDDSRARHCLSLGARGVINRREFDHWGRLPDIDDEKSFSSWLSGVRKFGKKFWEVLGERLAPRIVFEHSGQDTLPTSLYLCDTGGMVVTCGGTSGYNGDLDLRFLWMRQKRLQGSHFANNRECRALVELVTQGRIDPCLATVLSFDEVGKAHQLMYENRHAPGNTAVLVSAPHTGLRTWG